MGGRMLFPAFPHARFLPWVVLVLSAVSIAMGLLDENDGAVILGVGAIAFVVLAYGVARLVVGKPLDDDAEEQPPDAG